MRRLLDLGYQFYNTIFPNCCMGCNQPLQAGEDLVCLACQMALPLTEPSPTAAYNLAERLTAPFPYRHGKAYFVFRRRGPGQRLIHQLKYEKQPEIGVMLGRWFGQHLKAMGTQPPMDLLIPVPLHPKKQAIRGYNQAERIASGLSESLGIPVSEQLLLRIRYTSTQTLKTREERQQNMVNAFGVQAQDMLAGQHVALVDDVVTTGATLAACAQTLQQAGAASVSFLVLADAGHLI